MRLLLAPQDHSCSWIPAEADQWVKPQTTGHDSILCVTRQKVSIGTTDDKGKELEMCLNVSAHNCVLVKYEVGKLILSPYETTFGRMLLLRGSSSMGGGPGII